MTRVNNLGHTYANSLMAASEHLFWTITAQQGLVAYVLMLLMPLLRSHHPYIPYRCSLIMHFMNSGQSIWSIPKSLQIALLFVYNTLSKDIQSRPDFGSATLTKSFNKLAFTQPHMNHAFTMLQSMGKWHSSYIKLISLLSPLPPRKQQSQQHDHKSNQYYFHTITKLY